MSTEPRKFRNFYRCPRDGTDWFDEWSCACNDRCPTCNTEIEPFASNELCLHCHAVVDSVEDGKCPNCGEPVEDSDTPQTEPLGEAPNLAGSTSLAPVLSTEEWIVLARRGNNAAILAYEFSSEEEARSFVLSAPAYPDLRLHLFHATLVASR